MRFVTPVFWYKKHAWLSWLLMPFSWLYRLASVLRYALVQPERIGIPIICVGNVTAGGAGKTPVAIAIAHYLQQRGEHPVFLSRGYGGTITPPHPVAMTDTAAQVGDEPLLLRRIAPVWIARRRAEGAKAAMRQGASVIIMDDGFQNPSLYKDISLLVIDGAYGTGNNRLLPAGPLREPLANALARSNAVVLIGHTDETRFAPLPILRATIRPLPNERVEGKAFIAFAGIAQPQKFFQSLKETGANLIAIHHFPDHYPYKDHEITTLLAEAESKNARLITTEKDLVRIAERFHPHIATLPIMLEWEDEAALGRVLGR